MDQSLRSYMSSPPPPHPSIPPRPVTQSPDLQDHKFIIQPPGIPKAERQGLPINFLYPATRSQPSGSANQVSPTRSRFLSKQESSSTRTDSMEAPISSNILPSSLPSKPSHDLISPTRADVIITPTSPVLLRYDGQPLNQPRTRIPRVLALRKRRPNNPNPRLGGQRLSMPPQLPVVPYRPQAWAPFHLLSPPLCRNHQSPIRPRKESELLLEQENVVRMYVFVPTNVNT